MEKTQETFDNQSKINEGKEKEKKKKNNDKKGYCKDFFVLDTNT